MHGATSTGPRRYCRPIIKDIKPAPRRDDLPDPPMLEPELEIARAKMRGGKTLAETALAQNQQRILTASLSATPGAYSRSGSGFGSSLSLGAPPQMLRAPAVRGGMLRDDGAFVPPGEIGD